MSDGVMKRMGMIFRAKANKALDRAEDPRETLDYSYQKQLELLTKVRRGVADVATSRKRIEIQMQQLQSSADKLQPPSRGQPAARRPADPPRAAAGGGGEAHHRLAAAADEDRRVPHAQGNRQG